MIHLSSPPQVSNSPTGFDLLHSTANNSINDDSAFAKLLSYEISSNENEISGQKSAELNAESSITEEAEKSEDLTVFTSIAEKQQESTEIWNNNSFLSENSILTAIQMENSSIIEENTLEIEGNQALTGSFTFTEEDNNEINGELAVNFTNTENIAGNNHVDRQESHQFVQNTDGLPADDGGESEIALIQQEFVMEELGHEENEATLNNKVQTAFMQEEFKLEDRINLQNEQFQNLEQRVSEGSFAKNGEIQINRPVNKGRSNMEIRDLRTERQDLQTSNNVFNAVKVDAANTLEMEYPLDLRASGKEIVQNKFENMLARELRGELSTDIIRNAQIIIRDGGEGTIRLSLKPAFLGDVKIHLEMVENKITGLIVLESNDALRAFERELASLEKAFRDSGFSEAKLSLALAQDGWNFHGREQEEELNPLSYAMAASSYQAEVEEVIVQSDAVYTQKAERTPINLLV